MAPRLIARSDELEALAAGVRNGLNILSGWRFEQFGKDALDLVEGRLAFAIEDGKLKMSRVVERGTRRCVSCCCFPLSCSLPARRHRRAEIPCSRRRIRAAPAMPRGPSSFIGQPGTSETGAAILRATNSRRPALGAAGHMMTMDFSASRVTVRLDSANRITAINCG